MKNAIPLNMLVSQSQEFAKFARGMIELYNAQTPDFEFRLEDSKPKDALSLFKSCGSDAYIAVLPLSELPALFKSGCLANLDTFKPFTIHENYLIPTLTPCTFDNSLYGLT